MTIDLTRFHRTFFEESFEGLDAMEAALLQLDVGRVDAETINSIFRAAHSIKGGAGTFGFSAVSEFTHLVETLLDRVRAGQHALSQPDVDLLLRSVDLTRAMLRGAQDGSAVDVDMVAALRAELEATLAGARPAPAAAAQIAAAGPAPAPVPTIGGWRIRFAPKPEMFASGNDPLRILRELRSLGHLELHVDTTLLPGLALARPDECYLAWDVELATEAARDKIDDVFAWVEDECTLQIAPLAPSAAPVIAPAEAAGVAAPPATPVAAAPEAAPPAERPQLKLIEGGRVAPSAPATPPAAPAVAPAAAAPAGAGRDAKPAEGGSIRVSTEKIDALVNLVGELVITQAMLQQLSGALDPVTNERLLNGLSQLDRNTRMLQEAVMSTRMLPMEFVFSRFPRMVRDLATKLGKQARLTTIGESTELDKSVIERIADPLTHLVRNSIDHGIEPPEARLAAGKDAQGTITLKAAHQGGHIVIQISDDGRGLDRARILAKATAQGLPVSEAMSDAEVWQLIFAPGFSTAEVVTDVSGRGVGMDVVKKNIDALGGRVEIGTQPGRGTTVTIRLPLTLAILDGMSVRVGSEIFIVPLSSIIESLQPQPGQIKSLAGQARLVNVRSEYLPLATLHEIFGVGAAPRPETGILVILESEGRKIAAQVDELVGQQQVVIKSLEANYRRVQGISGATILGDGRVALIIDVGELVRVFSRAQAA